MPEPSVLITGTGRCGTGYVSTLLRHCGILCGHENWWHPAEGATLHRLDVDASWCALGLGLEEYEGEVLGQVRHPLDVVTSLAFAPPHDGYRELYVGRMGEDPTDPTEWAALATTTFIELTLMHAERWWRLEELGPLMVQRVAGWCGRPTHWAQATTALKLTDRRTNAHRLQPRLELEAIPSLELRDRVALDVKQLGYDSCA